MFDAQRGVCAICADREKPLASCMTPRPLVVDHDHETGAVRGLLCNQCNRGIGMLGDSSTYLNRAAEYLDASKARQTSDSPVTPPAVVANPPPPSNTA